MNLKNKLNGIPNIYYTNLDRRTDRREYMESQFERWGLNFRRISSSKYLSSEEDKWQHLVLDDIINLSSSAVANSITHIEMLKYWLDTTYEQSLVIMEDDYDLSLIEHWNFDWNFLMNNVPGNWDCIQLGFENEHIIPFFLHPPHFNHGFGPCLISREYDEKLVRMHYFDGSFKLNLKHNDVRHDPYMYGSVDSLFLEGGRTYSIPLITTNPDFDSDDSRDGKARWWFPECRKLYYYWWENEHHNFSLDDFFTYGKPNDNAMIRKVKNGIKYRIH